MDVKGITWVGNVYQKFEAMCLEVEEVMYQDTVKYVENQVQNVGASVKRFYSDVMQDLLSPTSLGDEKASPFCFTVEQDSDEGICKKMNASKKKEPSKAGSEQLSGSLKVTSDTGEDVGVAPLIHVRLDVDNLCRPSGDFGGACSGLRSRKRHDQSKSNCSNFGVNQNRCEEKLSSVETSHAISPEKYLSRALSSYGQYVNENREVSKNQIAKVTTPSLNEDFLSHTSVESCNDNEYASRLIADLSNDFQSSKEIVLIESVGKDIEVPSSGGVLAGSNGSSQSNDARYDKYVDEEIFVPQLSSPKKLFDWDLATDIETANEHEVETIQQSNKTKLEETIVVVNEDDLRFLPQLESKKRPYKEKIRDALYPRMRSGRKHEYKQLALQYEDSKNPNHESGETSTPALAVDDTNKLPHHDSCESEWELL